MSEKGCRIAHRALLLTTVLLLLDLVSGVAADARPGYLRNPDIYGDQVVFTAEGDLWIASIDGKAVRRITSHEGDEISARFSPDGQMITFTGDYDGNRDLFVVPSVGGVPKRLTWHPAGDYVIDWTPDGEEILFSSAGHTPHHDMELFRVSVKGGEATKLPLGRANYVGIDPETGQWAFTRTWGGGTWKRYRGGTAANLWVGHPDRADFTEVTDFDGSEIYPMWHDGRIYFLCDQGGTGNIWSILPDGSDRKRHTDLGKWDARHPAMGPDGRIVFMHAGGIMMFDPATRKTTAIEIDLPSERTLTRTRYPDPARYVTDFALSPDGERVAAVARGEIFSIPVEKGVTLPITRGSGARESRVDFDPDGKRVVYVTDEDGEQQIVTADAWGQGEIKRVKGADRSGWHFQPLWSPDGDSFAYADMTHRLYLAKADGGSPREIAHCKESEIRYYQWSPDSRWIAYSKSNEIDYGSIFIYDTKEDETHQVTGWSTDDRDPTWDPKGRYLYFLSNRSIDPLIGDFDFETISVKATRPYMILLRSDVENPFHDDEGLPAVDDDKKEDEEKGDEDKDKEDGDEEKVEPIEIEFTRLVDRVLELPVEPGQYFTPSATEGKLFYISLPLSGIANLDIFGTDGPRASLIAFDLEEKEASTFLSGVSGYHLQPEAGKIAVMKQRGEIYVLDAGSPPGDDLSESQVSLDGVVIELDPREEWRQVYYEGWRYMRDFYWEAGMHGLDWREIRDQYASLLPRISTRSDLRDLMAEMIGELSTSHTYIFGGDRGRSVPRRSTGLLGAVLKREGDFFHVEKIYRGDPADQVRSPLLEPGVDITEGDYILSINQQSFSEDEPFEASLENLAGKPVMITVNDKPETEGARHVVLTPIPSEHELIYADWVRRNREYVAEKTGGRIGYVHLPDMMGSGLVAFNRWFYPQLDRDGIIIDCRWNGGGFVSQLILARLQRRIISWDRSRWGGVYPYPYRTLNGPFVVLMNENSGSDGDIFPAAVQLAGIAPVIGKRTWGGVVGIRGFRSLVDGGAITQPESAWWDHTRGWDLEGRGVEPDIEVTNLPQELARGTDAQLDRGIREILRLRKEHPPIKPEFGPAPDRSRKAYREEL